MFPRRQNLYATLAAIRSNFDQTAPVARVLEMIVGAKKTPLLAELVPNDFELLYVRRKDSHLGIPRSTFFQTHQLKHLLGKG